MIYTGEEARISLWRDALIKHNDWYVIAADELAQDLNVLGKRCISDNDVFLPVSLRADFIDCSKWVEQAIARKNSTLKQA